MIFRVNQSGMFLCYVLAYTFTLNNLLMSVSYGIKIQSVIVSRGGIILGIM